VVGCSPWVFTNAGAVGYYRTQYDPDDLMKLNDAVTSRLTTAERVALVNDESALTQAGREKIGVFLDLVGKLSSDQERSVVESYLPALERINDYLLTDADRELFAGWLRASFRPMLAKVGWTPAPDENADARLLRADLVELLGMAGEDPDVISESTKRARQYLDDPNSVDATLADKILKVAARNGNADLFDQYVAGLQRMKSPEQFYNVAQSLREFRDPQLVERMLQMAISPAIRNQDAMGLIARVLQRPANQSTAWAWVKSHWTEVEKKAASANILAVLDGAGSFCDPAARDDVQQFFTLHPTGSDRPLKFELERINACISYRDHQQGELAGWLQQHAGSGASAAR
jgi:aminopeptidase N